jgi:hypothetical protein
MSPTWKSQGPSSITPLNSNENQFVGAVKAVVAHPTDPKIIWVGTIKRQGLLFR